MKVNREQFLVLAITLSAAASGCKFASKHDELSVQPSPENPAAAPNAPGQTPAAQGAAAGEPAVGANGAAQGLTQSAKNAGAARSGLTSTSPTKELGVTTSPTKELGITSSPTKEVGVAPTKEIGAVSPTKEVLKKPLPPPTKEVGAKTY